MAEVFRVRANGGRFDGRQLALKRLLPSLRKDEEAVRLFTAEAELSQHLHHPNIVQVLDVGRDDESIFIVMDFIDGRDVAQIIKRCKQKKVPWPIDFALYLARALLEALDYAHHAKGPDGRPLGIIHCDVSPSNFFVSRTGELVLGDFGVARSLIEVGPDQVMGKPYYLSPEAVSGHLDPTIDLWAVGVTLYELLTLQRPFLGKTSQEVFSAIKLSHYTPVRELRPDVPAIVEGLIARAFDPDPAMRFRTAREFADEIAPLYDERVGTPLAISAVVRGLFGTSD
ncbi:MAG: serine/threonine protein kinase [Archangium gephyra]|uniref:Serine/threonine protein kinase n=1 Tax=Archangium gephyra TaxID=48 RepID=A0A2W5TZJ3_9BACT|nr:MAG: serine/threonine protein kinase [Archangium gephyra]